ncbi:hypothetical protein [Metabacillus fastidiosus]|uniref:hypothetical protein n=1 Tax=Metabacillus fastidiosus TaxID=1458 RepID=UPI002DBBF4D0|nr:hypothetical protein [Metabacillus fastidiosus]MEC2076332.1 hypothetical protein [Metabacillus fastidiosus]
MKKYLIFIISFVLLYVVFQISSGLLLTAFYTPDFYALESVSSQNGVIGETISIPLLATLIIATLAYFLSQKTFKTSKH